jgi:hypothetical protein
MSECINETTVLSEKQNESVTRQSGSVCYVDVCREGTITHCTPHPLHLGTAVRLRLGPRPADGVRRSPRFFRYRPYANPPCRNHEGVHGLELCRAVEKMTYEVWYAPVRVPGAHR